MISTTPHMDTEGLACFQSHLARSQCYLEYGSGASTLYASDIAKIPRIISLETAPFWAQQVAQQRQNASGELVISHCDIGPVRDYGRPKSDERIHDYWRYMVTPWRAAKERHWVPDTVLIDGRFRVASFLYSLLCARVGTPLLFDDYFNRPHYFVVEQFCRVAERHGRMAVFRATPDHDTAELVACLAEHSVQFE